MGADGPGIFSDDVAADVRATYREHLEDGQSDEAAMDAVLAEFGSTGVDAEDGVVWLALAASQHRLGRLAPAVRDRALVYIESGHGIAAWDEVGRAAGRARRQALERLRQQLVGAQPARRRVRPRPARPETDLRPGTVLAYLSSPGWWALLHVDSLSDTRYGLEPCVSWLEWDGDALPAAADVSDVVAAHRARARSTLHPAWLVRGTGRDDDWRAAGFTELVGFPADPGGGSFEWRQATSWKALATRLDTQLRERPAPGTPEEWW